jgi:hydrogenase-4 component F
MLDSLSAYHLVIMMGIFSLSAFYSIRYFGREIERGEFSLRLARRFGGLWFGSMGAMALVLVSNNLGILWVGIEATTLITAFLICLHLSAGALEAMWKYLLMCSVGVALAFTGTLLVAASTGPAHLPAGEALLWTNLMNSASRLNPTLLKVGFVFLVIGYGTKAGLAPLHNWLPDAHSQAPAPVSAIFSGFLLNAALYGLLRYLPLLQGTSGQGEWGRSILVALGLLSILVASVFIIAQHDVKRLLAYHSVEHLGIIALGVGLGGVGAFAALFHTLNHSLCKSLSFFCAGHLGQTYGTHDMRRLTGILRLSPVWGGGLFGSLLALIGVAPFALFLSEFLILKAAVESGAYWAAGLFLLGVGVVFVGALKHAISMAWDPAPAGTPPAGAHPLEALLIFAPLGLLLLLGLWVPGPLAAVLTQTAQILGGGR